MKDFDWMKVIGQNGKTEKPNGFLRYFTKKK
jgi:hypothetical protein